MLTDFESITGMMAPSNPVSPEIELLKRMQEGDEVAFVALYRRWQEGIFRFALQMSGSEAMAEDVTQEVFLTLMREPGRFNPNRGALSSYLYGISRNLILQAFHKGRLLVPLDAARPGKDGDLQEVLAAPHDLLDDLTRQEGIAAVRQAVLALPPHYREVVVLCDLEELSYQEAAEICRCAVGTIRSRLNRAHKLLLERLNKLINVSPAYPAGRVVRSLV
jgi:RNA polymerase sigma-70 factor (ECF subfamily)